MTLTEEQKLQGGEADEYTYGPEGMCLTLRPPAPPAAGATAAAAGRGGGGGAPPPLSKSQLARRSATRLRVLPRNRRPQPLQSCATRYAHTARRHPPLRVPFDENVVVVVKPQGMETLAAQIARFLGRALRRPEAPDRSS